MLRKENKLYYTKFTMKITKAGKKAEDKKIGIEYKDNKEKA